MRDVFFQMGTRRTAKQSAIKTEITDLRSNQTLRTISENPTLPHAHPASAKWWHSRHARSAGNSAGSCTPSDAAAGVRGVTDWFLTSQCVFDQFRNMWSEPFLCKVKFRSGMFVNCLDEYEQGRFGAQSWSYNTPNSREIIAADCALLHVVSRRKDSLLLCLRIHCLTTEQKSIQWK
jgi:hypothetical protein